jgi:hypothetical protein
MQVLYQLSYTPARGGTPILAAENEGFSWQRSERPVNGS